MRDIEEPKPGRRKYEFLPMVDQGWKLAEAGTDFKSASTFYNTLRTWANRNGFRYEARPQDEGDMAFRLTGPALRSRGCWSGECTHAHNGQACTR